MSTIDRFKAFVHVSPSGCWEWTGHIEPNGYGRFNLAGRMQWAQRVAWTLFRGWIPNGHDVCHHCDNRRCVNPDHLFTGTRAENMADAVAKRRTTIGERNAAARLTEADVRAIRAAYRSGALQRELAARFGVSRRAIGMVLSGQRWGHVA